MHNLTQEFFVKTYQKQEKQKKEKTWLFQIEGFTSDRDIYIFTRVRSLDDFLHTRTHKKKTSLYLRVLRLVLVRKWMVVC